MSFLSPIVRRTSLTLRRHVPSAVKCQSYCCGEGCDPNEKKGIILGVYDDNGEPCMTNATCKYNELMQGRLFQLMCESGVQDILARGKARCFNNIYCEHWSTCVVGLGPKGLGYCESECIDESLENVRVAAAVGASKLRKEGCGCIQVEGLGHPEQAAEGAALALWRYQELKNKCDRALEPVLELHDDPNQDDWQRGLFKAESQNLVRRLADTPANLMTPLDFAQVAVDELCPCGIKVDVHDKDWIESKKMNAFLTVARGSCAPPLFLEVQYCGGPPDQKPILMIGKGITFDSGGLCLKKAKHMDASRSNMAGAATVVACMRASAALSLPINIVGLIPLCENMPSGMAMKCGDVVMGMNGKSIRIKNTDHEGRLVLVDAMVYGQEAHKPRLIMDVATMSKGTASALGSAASACFSNSHSMWQQLHDAGVISGDRVWRMPLWKYYTQCVAHGTSVDVCNQGVGKGDPCLAAAFLQEFVQCVDWIHLDIHGVGKKCRDKMYPYLRKGRMTGRPTRTVIQFLYQIACPEDKKDPCAKKK